MVLQAAGVAVENYVRRRNLSHRSRAVDASTVTVRRTYGGRTEALRQSV